MNHPVRAIGKALTGRARGLACLTLVVIVQAATALPAGAAYSAGEFNGGPQYARRQMKEVRFHHSATLLEGPRCRDGARADYCGKVLVVGGQIPPRGDNCNGVPGAGFKSAELYDPTVAPVTRLILGFDAQGQVVCPGVDPAWKAVRGTLHDTRYGHTATLLDGAPCHRGSAPAYCGKVLIVGGVTGTASSARQAELYDPETESFELLPNQLSATRNGHTATLLDGPACASAAASIPSYCGRVLIAGGATPVVPSTPYSGCCVINGVPGSNGLDTLPGTAEVFDPGPDTFTLTPAMKTDRVGHTATMLDGPACRPVAPRLAAAYCGKVLAAGGAASSGVLKLGSVELYDPAANSWTLTGPMTDKRSGHTAALLDGPQCHHVFSADSPAPVSCGRVLVESGAAETYDPAAGKWTSTGSMRQGGRQGETATAITAGAGCTLIPAPTFCGSILVVGGASNLDSELYDPVTGVWKATSSIDNTSQGEDPRFPDQTVSQGYGSATVLENGTVLLAGGNQGNAPPFGYSMTFRGAEQNPVVTGLDTHKGQSQGGTVVVISGYDFAGAGYKLSADRLDVLPNIDPATGRNLGVQFVTPKPNGNGAAVAATSFTVDSDQQITAVSPPHATGPVEVIVTTPWADSRCNVNCADAPRFTTSGTYVPGRYTYNYVDQVAPTVTHLDPPTGPYGGGTPITVTGTQFSPDSVVKLDDQPVTATVDRDTSLKIVSPPHAAGTAHVTVANSVATSPVSDSDVFTWVRASPTVTAIEPPGGPTFGGTPVTITGTNLTAATTVTFGDVPATSVTRKSDTQVVAVTPPQIQGVVNLTVTNGVDPAWISTTPVDPRFTYGSGAWAPTATQLSSTRYRHTATLLDGPACHAAAGAQPAFCGKVLVAGGSFQAVLGGPASAQLYDPATGAWAPTGRPMNTPRIDHTATALGDGRVLIAGGRDDSGNGIAQAEIYDPAADYTVSTSADASKSPWTNTSAPMSTGRFMHSATLLNDGTVLVAGGIQQIQVSQSANGVTDVNLNGRVSPTSTEIFDPTSGTWSSAGSLGTGRSNHTATLLPGGKVLVAGGINQAAGAAANGALGSAELYDPAAKSWSAVGTLATPRFSHTATLLTGASCGRDCGKVLVVGGSPGTAPGNPVPGQTGVQTGGSYPFFVSTTELFDPGSNTWSNAATLKLGRADHSATLLPDGKVLVAGRFTDQFSGTPADSALSSAEVFDPLANDGAGDWNFTSSMRSARGLHTATVLDGPACRNVATVPTYCGTVLATGGADRDTGLDTAIVPGNFVSAEVYTPAPDILSIAPSTGPSGGDVTFSGYGYVGVTRVDFGSDPATHYATHSATEMVAGTPPHAAGVVDVAVTNAGGTSATIRHDLASQFLFDGCGLPPVPGQVSYQPGYHLIGLPTGTSVPSESPLYGWLNRSAGRYSVDDPRTATTVGGVGYWAYVSCQRSVTPAPTGAASVNLPLSAYRASMVGNPSASSPAVASGFDFGARWVPSLNNGAGGYDISAYRAPQQLAVGEGMWTFSYRDTTVNVNSPR